jgi:uncharacterized protein with NRDE domain
MTFSSVFQLNVPGGVNRDRSQEVLLVHEDGTVFTVIPQVFSIENL